MPLPTPESGESEQDFIPRCMGNSAMNREFPDKKQRAGVCYSQWRKRSEDMKEEFSCECIECGHKMTSEQHCSELKCPECGGQMRRVERPGPGRDDGESIKIPTTEFRRVGDGVLEKVTEYSFDPSKFTEEKAKKWIQKATTKKTKGDFTDWCKRNGFDGVSQACINNAAKTGGRASKMAMFAVNASKGKYTYPKKKEK